MSIRLASAALRTQFAEDTAITIEDYSPHGGVPHRVLRVGSKRVVDMGNRCNTCAWLFSHLADPPRRVVTDALAENLRQGLSLTKGYWWKVIDAIFPLLPRGAYEISLLRLTPVPVQPGTPEDYFISEQLPLWESYVIDGPNDPQTAYYRSMTQPLGRQRLYEFVVPLFDVSRLDSQTVEGYRHAIHDGAQPTAVALTLLDWRQPAMWPGDPVVSEHFLLSHYLLDGHHKVYAASQEHAPLTLLSFLARDHSLASFDAVARVFSSLRETTSDQHRVNSQ